MRESQPTHLSSVSRSASPDSPHSTSNCGRPLAMTSSPLPSPDRSAKFFMKKLLLGRSIQPA